MRAVILAGGEGSRLRPLSLNHPKPMTSLLDRPVLEHIIGLLKSHGITQLCITLCHHPQDIMAHFGDGTQFGVEITYFIEETPLGTAGGVKSAMAQLGGEDFLVIGGDCICDLDLSAAIRLHGEKKGVATLVLHPCKTPLEYGLVHLDTQGRVTHFLEKPTWGQVMTNLVNTGIYILTPQAMERVPEGGCWDFGKNLFPALLAEGEPLYGAVLEGYWRDMGDCHSYLECCADILHGRVQVEMGVPKIGRGIWSTIPIPKGVTLIAPCYIGGEVELAPHSIIGPHVVLEQGCQVGEGAMVQRTVMQRNSTLGAGATAYGAILCPNARGEAGAILHRGAVVGEGARVAQGATLMEGVRLWPRRATAKGERVRHSITGERAFPPLSFGDGGIIRIMLDDGLDIQGMMVLGGLMAAQGEMLLGYCGGNGGRILCQAFASGVGAAGGEVAFHRLATPAQASWLMGQRGRGCSLFVEQVGERCYLHLTGRGGLPLPPSTQRGLEWGLQLGDIPQVEGTKIGGVVALPTEERDYCKAVVTTAPLYRIPLHHVTLAVSGEGGLAPALSAMGCTVLSGWRHGVAAFSLSYGGMRLVARDEDGAEVDSGQLLALVTLIEMEHGDGVVAVPAAATAAVELVATGLGGRVLRLGRDGQQGEECYEKLPWLRDGTFAAARIASRMAMTGESLKGMLQKIPRLATQRREVPLAGGRGEVMEALVGDSPQGNHGGEGVRFHTRGGWVYLAPLSRRAALQVVAEGVDMELSAELCDQYTAHIQAIDRRCCEQDSQVIPEN